MPRQKKDNKPPEDAVEIRYDGPTHVLQIESEDVTIDRGKTGYVSKEMAEHLLGCSYADVTAISPEAPAVWPGTDEKIDQFAAELGVEWPDPVNGQAALTVADKVAYIKAAGYSPDGVRHVEDDDTIPKE